MNLSREEFLDRVIPEDGSYYYNIKFEGSDRLKQWEAKSKKELLAALKEKGRGSDVYVALASFVPGTNRKAANVLSKRVISWDMDCGEGKGFATQLEALEKLKEFCSDTNLPFPNLLLDSGYGWHGHYVVTEPLSAIAWKRIATKLKECMAQWGLAVDPVVTDDLSRILRVPETYNWKDRNDPKLVRVVISEPDIDIRDITTPLVAYAGPLVDAIPDLKPTGKKVDNSKLGVPPEYAVHRAEYIVNDCAVFNTMYATGGKDTSEPLWMAALHLLAYCEDGEEYAHNISNGHPEYTHNNTSAKFKARLLAKNSMGPTLCATFEQHCPNECGICVHNGKIKSPISLGNKPKGIVTLPKGYISTENGIYIAGDADTQPIQVTNWNIEDMKVLSLEGQGAVVAFTAVERNTRTPIVIPNSILGDLRSLNRIIAEQGIIVRTNSERSLAILMTSWSQQIRNSGLSRVGFNAFGWFTDKKREGFSTGGGVKWADAEKSQPVVYDSTTMGIYEPKGTIDAWKQATQLILDRQDGALIALLATSFGAPLIKFTSESGGVFSVVSPESGTGKSGTMRAAQAVWGNPVSGVNSLDDTDNAIIKRMGYVNNLPVYWDEIRGEKSFDGFLKALFRVGQGREKARLTASTDFQRSGKWETLIAVATNERITEHIQRADTVSDAGLRRVLEDEVAPIFREYDQAGAKVFKSLNNNYGHAGEIYAKYLVENKQLVEQIVEGVGLDLAKKLGKLGSESRVWLALATAIIAGAAIAKQLDLVKFDIPKLSNHMAKLISRSQSTALDTPITSSPKGVKTLLDAFIQRGGRLNSFLECNKLGRKGVIPVYSQASLDNASRSGGAVLGHVDEQDMVRVDISAFKAWIRQPIKQGGGGGIPYDVFRTLKQMKSYRDTKIALAAPLKENIKASYIPCFDVSLAELNGQ